MPREAGYSPAHMTLPAPIPDTSPALFPHPSPASDTKKGEVVMPREAGYSPAPIPNTSPAPVPDDLPARSQIPPRWTDLAPIQNRGEAVMPREAGIPPAFPQPAGCMLRLLEEKEKGRGIPRPCILARVSSPVCIACSQVRWPIPRSCAAHGQRPGDGVCGALRLRFGGCVRG